MKNTKAKKTSLTKSLNQVLADSHALMALTHSAHWNVEGPGFFALHTAFQTQYEELFTAIDEIAEHIRALGPYAIGGLNTFAHAAGMEEFAAPLSQEDYVKRLIAANNKLLDDAARAGRPGQRCRKSGPCDRAHHAAPEKGLDAQELPEGLKASTAKSGCNGLRLAGLIVRHSL